MHRSKIVVVVFLAPIAGMAHERIYPKVVLQHPVLSIWLFEKILHLPDQFVDVKFQESEASFRHLNFGHIFHLPDFCSFYIAWVCFRDAESRGW